MLRITLSYPIISPSLSIEHRVLCRLIRPAVLLHLATPKMVDKHDRDSSSETESDSGDRYDVKMQECHLRETEFAKCPGGGGNTPDPLGARALGARTSKILPIFLQKGLESLLKTQSRTFTQSYSYLST